METIDIGRLALNSLFNRRLRSWLTVLGIVIGIAALVGLLALGAGFQRVIEGQLSVLGGDSITVTPGVSRASGDARFTEAIQGTTTIERFTDTEVRAVGSVKGIEYVDGIVSGLAFVSFRGETAALTVKGVDSAVWPLMENRDLVSGRLLVSGDRNAAVITDSVAAEVFDEEVHLNRVIVVGQEKLRVVGILEGAASFGFPDEIIFTPAQTARDVLGIDDGVVTSIEAQTVPGAKIADVREEVETRLLSARHLLPKDIDFTMVTGEEVQEEVGKAIASFRGFITAIAAIGLLVGGVGIANSMFMSVMERSRQIGILKALGATDREVMGMFLAESSLLGLLGGLLGVGLGFFIAWLITSVGGFALGPPGSDPPEIRIDVVLAAQAVFFALVVGAIAGILPARRAARLDPVDTLRSE